MKTELALNPNPLVQYLGKPSSSFTKEDIISYVEGNGIKMINFRYVGGDGRLKTLNFIISSKKHLDTLLSTGERVDGSSLFSYVESGKSDLYVVPKYKTAFLNPFASVPTLDILCSYFDKDGQPFTGSPDYILKKAHDTLKEKTGYTLDAMGELEYYVIAENNNFYPARDQKGYHESYPFTKFESLRVEAMQAIAQAGGLIKYGHSEVGNFTQGIYYHEQNEIEFLPTNIEDAADQLLIAKWIIRMYGYKYGVNISFAPKITVGKAGSGLHVHMRLMKDGKTATTSNGLLSDEAKKAIAGILELSPSLTAFGNTIPTSYLRLVPHQEAPTNICWGDRNRSVLVRVPLGWSGKAAEMINIANPNAHVETMELAEKQTFEFRCPDGSANIYLLFAGLLVGVRKGLQMTDALKKADDLYVDVNIFHDEHKAKCDSLDQLPISCWDSAEKLIEQEANYREYDVFPKIFLDGTVEMLKSYDDKDLSERLYGKHDEIRQLVEMYLHC